MTQGHLTIRDPDGRGFWMKRTGIGFAEVKGQKDFVLVDLAGDRLAGTGGVHGEWPIHAEIFRSRPDVNAVGHTHPFYACVFSACKEPLRAVAHEAASLKGAVPRYTGTSNLIDTPQLGRDVAQALGSGPAVLHEKPRHHFRRSVGRGLRAGRDFSRTRLSRPARGRRQRLCVGIPRRPGDAREIQNGDDAGLHKKFLGVLRPKLSRREAGTTFECETCQRRGSYVAIRSDRRGVNRAGSACYGARARKI